MHKSRKIIAATTFSLFFFFGYSQIETYDLSKFVQDDFSIRTLSVFPDFFFDSRSYEVGGQDASGGGSLSISYYNFINDQKKYKSFSSSNGISLRGDREDNDRSIRTSSGHSNDYLINRYYKGDKFFSFEIGNYISYTRDNNYISNENTNTFYLDNLLNITIGKGRIQNISDPLKALAILKLLRADNHLLREVSHHDIDKLSNILTSLRGLRNNNTRFTDSRLLRNERFELLGRSLVEMGLVENDGFGMAALLYDAWRFESFYNRFTNNEFRVGIESTQQYLESNNVFYTTGPQYFLGLFTSYKTNKPIDTEWYIQTENKIAYGYYYDKEIFGEEITYSQGPAMFLESSFVTGFQPSVRTNSRLGIDLRYWNYNLDSGALEYFLEGLFEFNIYGELSYYVSPQYRISGNLGVSNDRYNYRNNPRQKIVQVYFNFGVDYFFF